MPYYIIGVTTRLAREMHPQVVTSQRLKILRKGKLLLYPDAPCMEYLATFGPFLG